MSDRTPARAASLDLRDTAGDDRRWLAISVDLMAACSLVGIFVVGLWATVVIAQAL